MSNYRINDVDYIKVLGFKDLKNNLETEINLLDKIPKTDEFELLIQFLLQNPQFQNISSLNKAIENKLLTVRNNREYDYFNNLLKLLNKI